MGKKRAATATSAPTLPWKSSQLSRNVFEVRVPVVRNKSWEQWVLLTSDRHWDNTHSNWEMQKAHLEQAVERNAPVIDNGDFFCCMSGKFDKRSSKATVRPEHQRDDYLDALVDTASDWFKPYAKNFVVIGSGNHEDSIKTRWETDLCQRLVALLNSKAGASIGAGGFSGWVHFSFTLKIPGRGVPIMKTVKLHYDHGYGGGGPVTKDTIQHSRRASYINADIIVSGHTHDSWHYRDVRLSTTSRGVVRHDPVTHIKIPSYKDEYGDGSGGWHARTGKPPKPIGACWLRFHWCARNDTVLFDVIDAQ